MACKSEITKKYFQNVISFRFSIIRYIYIFPSCSQALFMKILLWMSKPFPDNFSHKKPNRSFLIETVYFSSLEVWSDYNSEGRFDSFVRQYDWYRTFLWVEGECFTDKWSFLTLKIFFKHENIEMLATKT